MNLTNSHFIANISQWDHYCEFVRLKHSRGENAIMADHPNPQIQYFDLPVVEVCCPHCYLHLIKKKEQAANLSSHNSQMLIQTWLHSYTYM